MGGHHYVQRVAAVLLVMALLPAYGAPSSPVAEVIRLDSEVWQRGALFCKNELPSEGVSSVQATCSDTSQCFPGEGREPMDVPSCGDGDMTLFNGLLCLAGIPSGCDAVSLAQNTTTGQWYRSPRLRSFPRLRQANTFSPDMALGVQLWALLERPVRSKQLKWWLEWIGRNQRCSGLGCADRIPRFCPDDDVDGDPGAELGCTLRPGDSATLAVVADRLGVSTRDENLRRVLLRWKRDAVTIAHSSALTNRPGYPQHLAAVNVLVLWRAGVRHPLLDASARHLSAHQPANAFFAWLNSEPMESVAAKALAKCPKSESEFPSISSRRDWIWQREDADDANTKNMIWDCRFIAALLKNRVAPKGER